jgi:hypothetical protein
MKGLAVLFGKSWARTLAHSMPCCTASPALAKAACPLARLLAIVFPQSEQTSLNRDPDRSNIIGLSAYLCYLASETPI